MYVNVLHLLSKTSPPVYCSWDRLDLYLFLDGHAPTFPWTSSVSIIDQFSKGAHFVALQKLPTTIESAQLLTRHVFLLHPTGNHLESRALELEVSLVQQPLLFPSKKVCFAAPSEQLHLSHCCQLLMAARAALLTTQERSKRLAYLRHGTHLLCRFDYLPKISSYEMYFRNYFRIALRPVRPEANENHSKSCSAQCKVA